MARRLGEIERQVAEAKQQQLRVRHELAILDESALTYYRRPDQVAQLIERVRSSRGGDVYKLRAQISSRLQSLIKELRLTTDEGDQHFEIIFRDGSGMMLFVDPEDPTRFIQRVRGKAPNYEMSFADGAVIDLPAEEDALDGK